MKPEPRIFDVPRWIDGRRIIDCGMAEHKLKDGKLLRYSFGRLVDDERVPSERPER